MDYKKKYEELYERISNLVRDYDCVSGLIDVREELKSILNESQESEEERIRKWLIGVIKSNEYGSISNVGEMPCPKPNVIAWLEKQGTPAKLSEEEQNKFAKGVLTSCAMSFIDYLDAHRYEGKMCVSNGECEDIENAFHNSMWDRLHRYYCKYIEKQCEQKLTRPVWKYKKDHTPLLRDSFILNKYGCVAQSPSGALVSNVWVLDFDELAKLPKEEFESQNEQKPIDKIEPRFRIGDFVKNTNYHGEPIYEIVYIDKECYICEYRGKENMGDKSVMHFSFDNPYLRFVQKPAWNEEDERIYKVVLEILNSWSKGTIGGFIIPPNTARYVNWFKSIKERYTWKPSESDILLLERIANGKSNPQDFQASLGGLIGRLKKLREE